MGRGERVKTEKNKLTQPHRRRPMLRPHPLIPLLHQLLRKPRHQRNFPGAALDLQRPIRHAPGEVLPDLALTTTTTSTPTLLITKPIPPRPSTSTNTSSSTSASLNSRIHQHQQPVRRRSRENPIGAIVNTLEPADGAFEMGPARE